MPRHVIEKALPEALRIFVERISMMRVLDSGFCS
jgi:hypothetical protein